MDTPGIQRILRGRRERLYANQLDNLEERETCLETYNRPRPPPEETETLNRPITSEDMGSVIKICPGRTAQDQMASLVNSTKHFKN